MKNINKNLCDNLSYKVANIIYDELNENIVTDKVKGIAEKVKAKLSKATIKLKGLINKNIDKAAAEVEKTDSLQDKSTFKKYMTALKHMSALASEDWEDGKMTEEKEMQLKLMIAIMVISFGGAEFFHSLFK